MPNSQPSFWSGFLNAALGAALNGAAQAQNSGANLQTVGVAAGATSLAGVLAYILQHPYGQHPAVVAAVSAPVIPSPPVNTPS